MAHPPPEPLILPPTSAAEFLTTLIRHQRYPTTLIICSTKTDFLKSLVEDAHPIQPRHQRSGQKTSPDDEVRPSARDDTIDTAQAAQELERLLSTPLYQVAIARHIRMVFVPTVTHLRAYLAVFTHQDTKIPVPPSVTYSSSSSDAPWLVVYGFLTLHRDTSEWSAQGLSSTAAGQVEAAERDGFRAVVVDPPLIPARDGESEKHDSEDDEYDESARGVKGLLTEQIPVLNNHARRVSIHFGDKAQGTRTVAVGIVLGRWFRYDLGNSDTGEEEAEFE